MGRVAIVDDGFENLNALACDHGAPQTPHELFALARKHRAADYFDPAEIACNKIHLFVGQVGNLRPIVIGPLNIPIQNKGGLPIRRRLPTCPTCYETPTPRLGRSFLTIIVSWIGSEAHSSAIVVTGSSGAVAGRPVGFVRNLSCSTFTDLPLASRWAGFTSLVRPLIERLSPVQKRTC